MGQRSSIKDDIWIGAPTPIDGKIELNDKSGFGVEPNY